MGLDYGPNLAGLSPFLFETIRLHGRRLPVLWLAVPLLAVAVSVGRPLGQPTQVSHPGIPARRAASVPQKYPYTPYISIFMAFLGHFVPKIVKVIKY